MLYDDSETVDWSETIEKVATKISTMGIELPAVLMLEAHKPLTFFANQGLVFLTPILYPLFGSKTERAAKFFEKRENVEQLIRRIEEKAEERSQQERAARAMRREHRRARKARRATRPKGKSDGTWEKL
ncbi:MAG: hypothetical protein JW889_06730 [Verrucomicrobia bacterium]|nr:hypothetical protein [Verrucomicrobiota bacterium]